jgi:uncharacterized protein YidB (DUF937 family)
MTITSAGSSPIAWQAGQAQQPLRRHHEKMLEPAAKALGISTDELKTQLKAGKSLSDVASAQGVSKDDLVSAIAADLKANAPQGAPPLSAAQLTQMATSIVEHKPGEGRGPGGPMRVDQASTARAQGNLASLADSLGTDPATLTQQLMWGDTSAIAKSTPWDAGKPAPTGGLLVDAYG